MANTRGSLKPPDPPSQAGSASGIWQSPEFRASVAAVSVAVIGIVLVAILQRLNIDNDPTIITLLLVPLLVYGIVSGRLRELTGPGGWGAKFAELEQKVEEQDERIDEAQGAAKNAEQLANLAAPAPEVQAQPQLAATVTPEDELAALVDEYNRIRATQSSGSTRTMNMTGVVRRMIELAPRLTKFDVDACLASDDRGQRLSAYAYLYARPDDRVLDDLVESVCVREDRPFGQYWGLQAISRNLTHKGQAALSAASIRRLQTLAASLPRGTDRDYVLRTILREIEPSNE